MKYLLSLVLLMSGSSLLHAQQVDLEHLRDYFGKGKPLQVNGGIAASSIFHTGANGAGRQPFTWNLNGSLGLNLLGKISLPFSFNLTNAGANYSYPVLPNRLSLHPTYKGITAHIGDVAMSFSPYSLNGYQFTGVGLDVSPQKEWQISLMYGRLQRAIAWDSLLPTQQPAYRRMGFGVKMGLNKEKFGLGMSFFRAADQGKEQPLHFDSLGLFPMTNVVMTWNGVVRPAKGLEFTVEYAASALQENRSDWMYGPGPRWNLMYLFMYDSDRTTFYKALNAHMNYTLRKTTLGIGYERIDPGYRTLGAYYFNNDQENITFNISQPFLSNKAMIAVNMGFQRDDLDHKKSGATSRMVSSMNLNYMPTDKLNMNLAYSNFQSYMHIKPQFDYINQVSPLENMDTLNFKQISQNATMNLNYSIRNSQVKTHNINLNISFQDAADLQNDVLRKGSGSQFYNVSTAYSLLFTKQQRSITAAYNLSYNTIGRNNFLTQGPTLGANAKFFHKKVTSGFSSSYNSSNSGAGAQGEVLNFRLNTAYLFMKKHHLSMTAVHQTRWIPDHPATQDMTATLGYNYNF